MSDLGVHMVDDLMATALQQMRCSHSRKLLGADCFFGCIVSRYVGASCNLTIESSSSFYPAACRLDQGFASSIRELFLLVL